MDLPIARIAAGQEGLVTRAQLLGAGFSRHAVDERIAAGRLHVIHRGVFAVGHPRLSRQGRWLAAVLAVGDGAVLSRRSAAALWELLDEDPTPIETTAPGYRRPHAGVRVHRAALEPHEIGTKQGIPATSPIRTLIDIAPTLKPWELERAIRNAEFHGHLRSTSLTAAVDAYPGRRGIRKLRTAAMNADLGTGITRSRFEERFRRFLRAHSLPQPKRNVCVQAGGVEVEVDCLWRRQRVVVELDGAAAHSGDGAFHRDRARDRDLLAAGYRVVRITWQQLTHEPDVIADALRRLLE